MVPHDQAADIEMICTDNARRCAPVAVSDLPAAVPRVDPRGTFFRVENDVAAVLNDLRREKSALDPSVGRASVEVQFAKLWWCANADFGNVQCVVFDIFDLHLISTAICFVKG